MSDPRAAANALLESILATHGQPREPAQVRDSTDGEAILFGSSVLDIRIRAAASADALPPHTRPASLDDASAYGSIEHRFSASERLRVDLWQWRASPDLGAEQSLDLSATFVWKGDAYRLELFSNSIDFGKGLGRELPSSMTWPSLLDVVREFVGAPPF